MEAKWLGIGHSPCLLPGVFPSSHVVRSCPGSLESAGPKAATVESRVPTPLAWLYGLNCGEGSHTPPPFSSFWVCNYFVFLTTTNKVCPYWKGFVCLFVLILPIVLILLSTFYITYFLIFHWLLCQANIICVMFYFLGKELCLTMCWALGPGGKNICHYN